MDSSTETRKRAHNEGSESHDSSPRTSSGPVRYNYATDPRTPSEPKRVACTHCRQSKLRCDATTEPCSRCQRLNLICSKDTSFKRVNKRSKIDELEAQVSQLRAVLAPGLSASSAVTNQLDTPAASPSTHAAAASLAALPNQNFSFAANLNPAGIQYPAIPESYRLNAPNAIQSPASTIIQQPATGTLDYSRPAATKVRAIECTAISQTQIDELFQIYFQNYHPFLPILDPSKSPDSYYDTCPLLFWTIIFVSCRKSDAALSAVLSKGVIHKVAWERISDPPLQFLGIQALTVLSMWPSTAMHLWSDTSMAFSNLAITSAMQMGLHRPCHAAEYLNRTVKRRETNYLSQQAMSPEDDQIGRKTWAACNIVAQHMSANFGQPPMVSCFNWAINQVCEDGQNETLHDIRNQLIIQRFCHRATITMTSHTADPIGLPSDNEFGVIMNMLEDDLNTLPSQFNGILSTIDEFYLLQARLYLQTFHWLCPTMTDFKKSGILRSYATSSKLITSFSSLDPSTSVLHYATIPFARSTFNAGYIIFKILNSSFSRFVDFDAGVALVEATQFALRRFSAAENDLAIRAANILSDIWMHRDDDPGEKATEPVLGLRSHLTAGMTYDAAFRWRKQTAKLATKAGEKVWPNSSASQVGSRTGGVDPVQAPLADTSFTALNWDLFEDLNWNWDFDVSTIPGPSTNVP